MRRPLPVTFCSLRSALGRGSPAPLAALLCTLAGSTLVRAEVGGEPGNCKPACRSGYYCQASRCVSLCNPQCPVGQRCVEGDCEPISQHGRPDRENFIAMLGAFHGGLNHAAPNMGELRVEFAGRYTAFQIGPVFGHRILSVRAAIQGHVPFQPFRGRPFFLIPTVNLGYAFGWIDDDNEGHRQDIFITPGLRLRYDLIPRMALLFDPIQLQINFLRLFSDRNTDVERVPVVPVSWNLVLGLAFLY